MGLFEKFNKGLRKTRNNMSGAIDTMLHGKNEIDDELYDDLEEILIMGDVGMNTAHELCEQLRDYVAKHSLRRPDQVKSAIKEIVAEMLQGVVGGLDRLAPGAEQPLLRAHARSKRATVRNI